MEQDEQIILNTDEMQSITGGMSDGATIGIAGGSGLVIGSGATGIYAHKKLREKKVIIDGLNAFIEERQQLIGELKSDVNKMAKLARSGKLKIRI